MLDVAKTRPLEFMSMKSILQGHLLQEMTEPMVPPAFPRVTQATVLRKEWLEGRHLIVDRMIDRTHLQNDLYFRCYGSFWITGLVWCC